jgi:enamine deaminase RidA (YjgF/YER057c/UK114 family)
MTRVNIESKSPYGERIGFSRAVRIGNIIAVSGTAPIGPDGKTANVGDLYGQTKVCLNIIKGAIEDAGGKLFDIIRTRVYLPDISRWGEAGRAHADFFHELMPACSFVEVKGLIDKDWLVEIEADCVIEG